VPAQRISKAFRDISATFQANPLNQDLVALRNENAIARSIRNLILTEPGERPFNPVLGSRVSSLLFETLDNQTAFAIKSEIINTIRNFEPRVTLNKVEVTPDFENNELHVSIRYNIVGIDVPGQELSFALEPTR
tara:strand:+ start:850 stop:1251 length:402 start_codon:yes stop_codon:yes gene_type:complete